MLEAQDERLSERRPARYALFDDPDSLSDSLERRGAARRAEERRGVLKAAHLMPVAPVGFRDLCHDLLQSVAAVIALVEGVHRQTGLAAEGQRRLAQAGREGERLAALLGNFLEPPAPVLVDLVELGRAATAHLTSRTAAAVELVVEGRAWVFGDPILLSRALSNLLQNAGQAASQDGRVRLAITCLDGVVVIDVEDTGDAARDARASGHGLGLTIVQAVIDSHHGVVSSGPSDLGGLRVRVRLPLALPDQEVR